MVPKAWIYDRKKIYFSFSLIWMIFRRKMEQGHICNWKSMYYNFDTVPFGSINFCFVHVYACLVNWFLQPGSTSFHLGRCLSDFFSSSSEIRRCLEHFIVTRKLFQNPQTFLFYKAGIWFRHWNNICVHFLMYLSIFRATKTS